MDRLRQWHAMNGSNTIPRRRAIELLGAGTLAATALRYAHAAGDKFKTKPRILFFSKSSGYEHDVVRRAAKGLSLSEATLTEIGRVNGFDVIATNAEEAINAVWCLWWQWQGWSALYAIFGGGGKKQSFDGAITCSGYTLF
jgi:hypothetical protein